MTLAVLPVLLLAPAARASDPSQAVTGTTAARVVRVDVPPRAVPVVVVPPVIVVVDVPPVVAPVAGVPAAARAVAGRQPAAAASRS